MKLSEIFDIKGIWNRDYPDTVMILSASIFSSIGIIVTVGAIIYGIGWLMGFGDHSNQSPTEVVANVSVQFNEVAEDGVYSSARKYTAERVIPSRCCTILEGATSEFGEKFKQVILINTPTIIEEK